MLHSKVASCLLIAFLIAGILADITCIAVRGGNFFTCIVLVLLGLPVLGFLGTCPVSSGRNSAYTC